jgi:hypothetical protein
VVDEEARPTGRRRGAALGEVKAGKPQVRGAEEVQRIHHRRKRRARRRRLEICLENVGQAEGSSSWRAEGFGAGVGRAHLGVGDRAVQNPLVGRSRAVGGR